MAQQTTNQNVKWYLIQVAPNYEQKVQEQLRNKDFEQGGISYSSIEEVLLPMTTVTTEAGKSKRKPMFPGYLFVKVDMTDESWYIIRNTEKVTGIVGSSGAGAKPTPINEIQIERMIAKSVQEDTQLKNVKDATKGNTKAIVTPSFKEGDIVEVKEGHFVGRTGKVQQISLINQSVSIELEMFGRKTSVELPLDVLVKSR